MCNPHRITTKSDAGSGCLDYSIGSNNDFSFEEGIPHDILPDCEIYTFDPAIGDHPSILPTNGHVEFHTWGLAANDDGSYKIQEMMRFHSRSMTSGAGWFSFLGGWMLS